MMERYKGRWILIIVLTTLLIAMYAYQSVDGKMNIEREYPDMNESISLHIDNNGVIHIEGDGKLFAKDFKRMIKSNKISYQDVKDIIIGDGITEIGYLTFNQIKYLKTLKIGSGVIRVVPSALKNCTSLEWLYLPSGVKEIGTDFLFGCDKCHVVTDAQSESMKTMHISGRIIAAVDSYKALQTAVGEDTVLPDALAEWWR